MRRRGGTVAIEVGGSWLRPGKFRSRWMRRYWCGPIAVTFMRGNLYEMRARAAAGLTEWREAKP